MKLPVLIVAGSIAANVVCAVALAVRPALAPPAVRDFFGLHDAAAEARLAEDARLAEASAAKSQAAQAKAAQSAQSQLWSALDSADLKTLVAHLRAAGFSKDVIRAMVSARMDARFAARRNEIASAAAQVPYWKAEVSGFNYNSKFYEEINAMYRERSRLTREILGDDFFSDNAAETTAQQYREYGDLPKAKIDLVSRINDDYAEMGSQIKAAMQGVTLPEDREKLALLEKEKRADLAAILTPDEMKAYEMRTSTFATRNKDALGIMDASEEEFRKLYEIQQPFADQIYPVGGVKGAEMSRIRKEAQAKVDEQLTAALGPERLAEFKRAGDYDYQQLYRLTQTEKLPVAVAAQAYDLRGATAKESVRISNDKSLSEDARLAALQTLAQNARTQFTTLLGSNAGPGFVSSASWLTHIQNGGSVSFDGNGTSFYSVPKSAQPKN